MHHLAPGKKSPVLSLDLYKSESGDEDVEVVKENGRVVRRREFRITLFGITEKGRTVCLRVTDFRPFFHVQLALRLTRQRMDAFVDWVRDAVCPSYQQQQQQLQKNGGDNRLTAAVEKYFVEETFEGEGKRDCIRLEFATDQLRKKALGFLRGEDPTALPYILRAHGPQGGGMEERGANAERQRRGYETYGGKMPSYHAFLHTTETHSTGWVFASLDNPRVRDGYSAECHAEYEISHASLKGNPSRLDRAKKLVVCFDAEMGSSHNDFPVPVKDYIKPASQIVEMCARHVHGVSVEAAQAFLYKALEHMFPPLLALSSNSLPVDCVYPKQSPFSESSSSPNSRSTWIEAMVQLFARNSLNQLMDMSTSKMRQVVHTLRIAAIYEKERRAKKAQEEAEVEEEEEGAAASGEANQESTEYFASDVQEQRPLQGKSSSPIADLVQKTSLSLQTNTFLDVLRARLDTDLAASSSSSASFGQNKKKRTAADAFDKSPPILSQLHKTQLLNQLLTLCLPSLEGDPVTFIGSSFELQDGDAAETAAAKEHHIVVTNDCAPIAGVIVHSVPDEKSLLLTWAKLMGQKRPHVIMSYNGFGFDNKFIFLRAKEHGIADQVFAFSRKADCTGLVEDWRTGTSGLECSQCRLATGDYNMERPHLPGVIQIDLLFYFRREQPSYTSYSLDAVATINIFDEVSAMDTLLVADLPATNAFDGSPVLMDWTDPLTVLPRDGGERLLRLETGNTAGLFVGNYICIQLLDGQIAVNFLTQTAWQATAQHSAITAGAASDARQKMQVLGIQKSHDGKRQFLLVDAAVAAAVRYQIAHASAERQRMLGDKITPPSLENEKAPSPLDDASAGEPVQKLNAGLQWCLVKDDVPHKEIFRLAKGSATDRAIVGKYCVNDCYLPLAIAKKQAVLPWYLETSSLCFVDPDTLVFNGQGKKLQSYVGKACYANRTLLRDLDKEIVAYDAATVLEPRVAVYNQEPVVVNDFSSLYPSIMAAWNLSPGTRVWSIYYRLGSVPGPKAGGPNLSYLDNGGLGAPYAYEGALRQERRAPGKSPFLFHGLPGREYVYTWYTLKTRVPSPHGGKDKVVNIGNKLVCWLAPAFADTTDSAASHPHLAGVYPQQALGLLAARQEKKNLQEQKGLQTYEKAVYKLQELVIKCSNNSVYGQLGSATSALRDLDVAASICSIGRLHIMYTKTLVERLYANRIVNVAPFGKMRARSCYVYGDTDSVFFCFNLETLNPAEHPDAFVPSGAPAWTEPKLIRGRVALQVAIVLGSDVARLVSETGPRPMGLAYEKTLMKFFIVSKKKYAGILHKYDPDKGVLKYMGLQVKKRDSCDCVRDVFGTIMARMLTDADDVEAMVKYLSAVVKAIVGGKLPPSKFLIVKTLKSGYATPMQVPHNLLADRIEARAPGTRPKPGDRVTYAFVVPEKGLVGLGKTGNLVKGQVIDTLEHILCSKLQIDYEYYVRFLVAQPVVQLLSLVVSTLVRELGTSQDRAELKEAMTTAAQYATSDLVKFNKIVKMASKRLVERIVFEPFLRELSNKNRGLQDISGFFGGGGGGGGAGSSAQDAAMPLLGPLIHRVPKRPLNTTNSSSSSSSSSSSAVVQPAAKLQKTMKQFFQLGGSRR